LTADLPSVSRRLRIAVGSKNAAKLEAVRIAFGEFFSECEVSGHEVSTGVSEQPIGFDEIVTGARNRAHLSYSVGNCDLGVGIEDGLVPLHPMPTGYINLGFCVIYDGRQEAFGHSSGFEYPPPCIEAATGFDREPIGMVFERVFEGRDRVVPRAGAGNIGRLTHGKLTRAEYGSHAVMCALVRLLHPDLYAHGGSKSS